MNVRVSLDSEEPLTEEQKKELEELDNYPIEFDEECPEFSDEELDGFQRVNKSVATLRSTAVG